MNITAPTADKIAKNLEMHGDVRVDNYYWLNDKENEEVIDYLERENDYYNKMTSHTKDFQTDLFEEMTLIGFDLARNMFKMSKSRSCAIIGKNYPALHHYYSCK